MPFKCDRATLINELEQLLRLIIADDADNTSEFEEIMDIYVAVTGSRYLNERSYVPKSRAVVDIVMQFSDREFKAISQNYSLPTKVYPDHRDWTKKIVNIKSFFKYLI